MKRLVSVIGLVLALCATSSVKAETIHEAAKFCWSIGWHPVTQATPAPGIFEGNYWEISVAEYTKTTTSIYFGITTHTIQTVVIDAEGNVTYTTWQQPYIGPPWLHHDAFSYEPAQNTFVCSIPNSYTSIVEETKFRVKNVVYQAAAAPNSSPGPLECTIVISGFTRPGNCTVGGFNPVWVDLHKNIGYVKNGTVIVTAPSGNYDIMGWKAGKGL
jgi:hypothetical protein